MFEKSTLDGIKIFGLITVDNPSCQRWKPFSLDENDQGCQRFQTQVFGRETVSNLISPVVNCWKLSKIYMKKKGQSCKPLATQGLSGKKIKELSTVEQDALGCPHPSMAAR